MDKAPDSWHEKNGPQVEEHFRKKEPGKDDAYYKQRTRDWLDASWPRISEKKRAEFLPKETPKEDGGLFEAMFGEKPRDKEHEERDLILEMLEF